MTWGYSRRSQALRHGWWAIGALLCTALSPALQAKETARATGTSSAVVVAPASLIKVQDLGFGKIVPRPTSGTITVNPDTGACVVTGAILEVGTCRAAQFTGMGQRNLFVRFQIPTTITLTAPGGATIVADAFTIGNSPDLLFIGGNGLGLGNGNRRWAIQPLNGIFTFNVGARLNVGANQAPGLYTGTFSVTVQYN